MMSEAEHEEIKTNAIAIAKAAQQHHHLKQFDVAWSEYDQAAHLFQRIGHEKTAKSLLLRAERCLSALRQNSEHAYPVSSTSSNLRFTVDSIPVSTPTDPAPNPPSTDSPSLLNLTSPRAAVAATLSNLKPFNEFFNFSAFRMPVSVVETKASVKANLTRFRANYFVVALCCLVYVILTTPILLVTAILLGMAYYASTTRPSSLPSCGHWTSSLTPQVRAALAVICLILVAFLLTSSLGALVFALVVSGIAVLLHASFYDPDTPSPSHPQDYVPQQDATDPESGMCTVCMTRPKNAAFVPCGHTTCSECAQALLTPHRSCPMCRSPIASVQNVFM